MFSHNIMPTVIDSLFLSNCSHSNPVQSEITIQYQGNEELLYIIDGGGKEVRHLRVKRGENRIDVSQLAAGVYFIRIGSSQVEFVKSN